MRLLIAHNPTHRRRGLTTLCVGSVHCIGQLALNILQLEPIDIVFASGGGYVTRFGSKNKRIWVPLLRIGSKIPHWRNGRASRSGFGVVHEVMLSENLGIVVQLFDNILRREGRRLLVPYIKCIVLDGGKRRCVIKARNIENFADGPDISVCLSI